MADEQEDKSQKTEQPTEHRIEEARKRGQVVVSKELVHWFMLFSIAIIVGAILPYSLNKISIILRGFLEFSYAFNADGGELIALIGRASQKVAFYLGLPFLFLIIAALSGTFLQTRFNLSAESIKPKLEKISILKGLGRLFSKKTIMEFFKAFFKFSVISTIVVLVMLPELHKVTAMVGFSIHELVREAHSQITLLLIFVVALLTLLAGIDYAFQRFEFFQNMKMTKQEVKEEYKEMEGDPHIKQKLRQIRQERSKRNIAKAVPEATVIITNPTHYSIALKYEMGDMEAPIVLAKGVDAVALRIREIAKDNKIPLYRNPSLARLLYATVDVNEQIKEEHYEAVAKVIRYVLDLKENKIKI